MFATGFTAAAARPMPSTAPAAEVWVPTSWSSGRSDVGSSAAAAPPTSPMPIKTMPTVRISLLIAATVYGGPARRYLLKAENRYTDQVAGAGDSGSSALLGASSPADHWPHGDAPNKRRQFRDAGSNDSSRNGYLPIGDRVRVGAGSRNAHRWPGRVCGQDLERAARGDDQRCCDGGAGLRAPGPQ